MMTNMFSSLTKTLIAVIFFPAFLSCMEQNKPRIFDVHLHGNEAPEKQLRVEQLSFLTQAQKEKIFYKFKHKIKLSPAIFCEASLSFFLCISLQTYKVLKTL